MRQHEALRVPQGWDGQAKALIIQLERILDRLYQFTEKTEKDLSEKGGTLEELSEDLDTVEAAVTALTTGKADASKFGFSAPITKWSIFSDTGKNIFIVRGSYKTTSDNDSYLQAVFNSNDKTITLVRKAGTGSETTLATWTGS